MAMFFRLDFAIHKLMMQFRCDPFRHRFEQPFPIAVSLFPPAPDYPQDRPRPDAICRAEAQREPDATVRSMFEVLSRDELPEGYDDSFRPPNESGTPYRLMPQLVFMPKPFRDFFDEVFDPMYATLMRVLDVLKWRFHRNGAGFGPGWDGYKYSFDGQSWHNGPSMIDPTAARVIDSFQGMKFGDHEAFALRAEIDSGSAEPLAHVLFREAWRLRLSNLRSALLIGFTAAEAGVKHHIVSMLPPTKNLLMPMPSPPIRDLLHYLDEIPHTAPRLGKGDKIPKSIRRALVEMGNMRNKVAHTGDHDPDPKEHKLTIDYLDEKLEAVSDLIWLLDYYAGHTWARENVSHDRLKELAEAKK